MNIDKEVRDSKAYIEKLAGKLTFGRLLWAIRQCDELSQVAFAKKLAISRQQLCDIEHDRRSISPKTAAQYAHTLGYSSKQFVTLSLQNSLDQAGIQMKVELKPYKPRRLLRSSF